MDEPEMGVDKDTGSETSEAKADKLPVFGFPSDVADKGLAAGGVEVTPCGGYGHQLKLLLVVGCVGEATGLGPGAGVGPGDPESRGGILAVGFGVAILNHVASFES